MLEVVGGVLRCDGREVPAAEVHGFEERFDPWRREATLRVRGPEHVEPIGPGYGALRRELRRAFPDRPFVSGWDDGRFPPGWVARRGWVVRTTWLVVGAVTVSVGLGVLGHAAGVAVACVVGWAVVRAMGTVRVARRGMAAGPPWAPTRPWHAVDRVTILARGEVSEVEVFGAAGGARATVPTVLVPALRAKVRRCGGLAIQARGDDADHAYAHLRPIMWGCAWGLLVGGVSAALMQSDPWDALGSAGLLALVGALAALAIEARATGWAFGAILSLTCLYGVALTWMTWSL